MNDTRRYFIFITRVRENRKGRKRLTLRVKSVCLANQTQYLRKSIKRWILIAFIGGFAHTGYAEGIDERGAIEFAAKNNSDLRAAILDLKAAQHAVTAAESEYTPVLQIETGAYHEDTPIATMEGITYGTIDKANVGVGISQRFSWGTQVSLELVGSGGSREINPQPTTSETIELGPIYDLEARLGAKQPLLKNAGNDVGEANLRIAKSRKRGAEYKRERVASELLRDVLTNYWELWYSESALQVYVRDRESALKQYGETKQKVELGAAAVTDTLSFETELATLEETVEQSRAARISIAVELGRLIGIEPKEAKYVEIKAPDKLPVIRMTREQATKRARKASNELREIEAELEVAREQLKLADDATQARFDLEGYLSAQGLGYQDALDPIEQVGTMSVVSAHVGLEFEFPISNVQRQSQLAEARFAVKSAQERLESRTRQVEASVAKQVEQLRAANQRVTLAKRTVNVAKKLVGAEHERYEIGTTTPLQVLKAQEDLRSAELRFAKSKVDQAKAILAILHLTADLLPHYATMRKRF